MTRYDISVRAVEPEFVHFNPLEGGCAHLVLELADICISETTHTQGKKTLPDAVGSVGVILMKSDVETVKHNLPKDPPQHVPLWRVTGKDQRGNLWYDDLVAAHSQREAESMLKEFVQNQGLVQTPELHFFAWPREVVKLVLMRV
jgi:hypothetical protein